MRGRIIRRFSVKPIIPGSVKNPPIQGSRNLDGIDIQAISEGSAMRRIPNWRKRPNDIR